jgi:BASS family bile acid:Na+ symporter
MFVIMPLVAVALDRWFDFSHTVEIALVALSISPVPPLLPQRETKAGGHHSYGLALMALLALLSIVVVPLALQLLQLVYGRPYTTPTTIAKVVLVMAILPLSAGMLVRALAPAVAARIDRPVAMLAKVLLGLGGLVLLVGVAPAIWALVGDGTVIAILLFLVSGYAVGHLLGGPDPDHSTVLAISTACRHPAIGFSIAAANYPDLHFGATIVLYLILGVLLGIPYTAWQRQNAAAHALA